MLKDTPYRELTKNKRAYEILLLRDQHDNTYTDIAKDFHLSASSVKTIYEDIKFRQIWLYINHISIALGHKHTQQIREIYEQAYDCYQNHACACAYLEKRYKEILDEYRGAEPGLPMRSIRRLPPLRTRLNKRTVARVVQMREAEKATFEKIAKKLKLTKEKARKTYQSFYHEKIMEIIHDAKDEEDEHALREFCFRQKRAYKNCYELLKKREG